MTRFPPTAVLLAAALAGGCGSSGSPAPPAADPPVRTPGGVTPEQAAAQADAAVNRVVQLLNGVTDEATARAAGPQLWTAAEALSAAGRQQLAVAEAHELAGRPAELPPPDGDLPPAVGRLLAALERVAKAPYGPAVREQLRAVIDAAGEMVPRAARPRYDEELTARGLHPLR